MHKQYHLETYLQSVLDDCCKGVGNWLKQVKDILCNNGYLYVWENPLCVDQDKFPIHFKQRLKRYFYTKHTYRIGCLQSIDIVQSN